MKRSLCLVLIACLGLFGGINAQAQNSQGDQLLRLGYDSAVTHAKREYFVYLPVGYESDQQKRWPVMFFLHGHGERGNGLDELDFVLKHGPLMEAWIQRRPLPFIIISPQLPLFGREEVLKERENEKKPERLESGVPDRNYGFPSDLPIQRTNAEDFPPGMYQQFEPYPDLDTLPAGLGPNR